jgi:hypothetical protein
LDSAERKRFAQASHEYLIDQVQILDFDNITQNRYGAKLEFFHPCKEIVGFAQPVAYRENPDFFTKTQITNYGINPDGTVNPFKNAEIMFHSRIRQFDIDSNYYNYVQPYEYHNSTPPDGINLFCFALHPEEEQPTGSCNFSRLSSKQMFITFRDGFIPELDEEVFESTVILRFYARNINILRFMSGMAGCAYSLS